MRRRRAKFVRSKALANPKLSEPTAGEIGWIQQQLDAAKLFIEAFSPADAGQPSSREALDRAFAAWLAQNSQDNAEVNGVINAVGIRFGQFLVDEANFRWVVASDAQGTDLAVLALPGRGDVLVYPANFVAKRWERRETPFLASAFDQIKQQVAEVEARGASAPPKPWWKFW